MSKKPEAIKEKAVGDKVPDENAVIRRISLVGIIGNVLLSAFKLFAGIFGRSGAMVSDAMHSMSDVAATLIAYIGVRLSRNEADESHQYGHERFECIASIALGVILTVTAVEIGKVGIKNIVGGNYSALAVPKAITLVAAVVSIAVKEGMFHYTKYYARILDSAAFMADAWHHRSDALSSVGSFVGIAGAMLGFPVLDSVAGVVICLIILKVAFDCIKDAVVKLLDTSCGKEFEEKISQYVGSQDEVVDVDMLHTRMFGNKIYVDIEIAVDGSKTLWEAHEVAERVHDSVEHEFKNIKHIMVHVNPIEC
ncbi:MAG: cation transporter [Oscillospiraceae bacterium]|nr:cation transporter [Oscillospiraceae bacterium]